MQIYAIIGENLAHTASPLIHTLAINKRQLDASYIRIEIAPLDFNETVHELKTDHRYVGFNVTIPYKSQILPYIDELDETAQKTGAVNTIRAEKRRWHGYNTDVDGFLSPLTKINRKLNSCLILGAGGAARAVVYALLHSAQNRTVTLCVRDERKGQNLYKDFESMFGSKKVNIKSFTMASDIYPDYDLIVNTTPVGMYPHTASSPLKFKKPLSRPLVVYDLIYNPPRTALLREAQNLSKSVVTISGVDMLIEQAAKAFNIWTGLEFPDKEARHLLLKTLSEDQK